MNIRILIAISLTTTASHASLTLMGNAQCTHPGSIVKNGSFEIGAPGPGNNLPNQRLWATGTTQNFLPFEVPANWGSAGNTNSYATWGNDNANTTTGIRNSEIFQDGVFGMYFGNGAAPTVDLSPAFNMDGTVTFSGTPTFTMSPNYPTPVTLSQSIPTHLNPAPKYCLSFWVSGEGAGNGNPGDLLSDGIFGLQITNVLAGDPEMWFRVPSGSVSPDGSSRYYMFELTPLNSSLPVDVTFKNYGHFDLTAHGRNGTTAELVLDDVRLAPIPEASASALCAIGLAGIGLLRRRR